MLRNIILVLLLAIIIIIIIIIIVKYNSSGTSRARLMKERHSNRPLQHPVLMLMNWYDQSYRNDDMF
jgi:hypothetical protein